jgi:HK97 gp10 family phage protein
MSSIKGLTQLLNKIDKLGGTSRELMPKIIAKELKRISGNAKALCPVNYGELRNSINTELIEKDGKIIGRVYTNNNHAAYVEFGTGPKGQENSGVLPAKIRSQITYKADGWYIPADKIDPKDAEKYRFTKITIKGMDFYYSRGQAAQPFLYPSLDSAQRKIIKYSIKYQLRKEIIRLGGKEFV